MVQHNVMVFMAVGGRHRSTVRYKNDLS